MKQLRKMPPLLLLLLLLLLRGVLVIDVLRSAMSVESGEWRMRPLALHHVQTRRRILSRFRADLTRLLLLLLLLKLHRIEDRIGESPIFFFFNIFLVFVLTQDVAIVAPLYGSVVMTPSCGAIFA